VALASALAEAIIDGSLTTSLQLACNCSAGATAVAILRVRDYPTLFPTPQPSPLPSAAPTPIPSPLPSPAPTLPPSAVPTSTPTSSPTRERCAAGTYTTELAFDCNFGNGFCGFVNTGSSAWVEGFSSSDSGSGAVSGPSEDRTTGYGTYVYAPASAHAATDQTFTMEASLDGSTGSISFYYHLDGCGDSLLTFHTQKASGVWTQRWSVAGHLSGATVAWQQVTLSLAATELNVKFVAFTAVGSAQSCAAALDDVYVSSVCTPCAKGRYQDAIASSVCLSCVNGSYCETTGLAATTGLCAAGKYSGCVGNVPPL